MTPHEIFFRLLHGNDPLLALAPMQDVTTLEFTRLCPVCDHHMDLSVIETVPWATRTAGERVVFRCEKCGMTQTEWNTISLVSPDIALR